jgi:hypothetical protein
MKDNKKHMSASHPVQGNPSEKHMTSSQQSNDTQHILELHC